MEKRHFKYGKQNTLPEKKNLRMSKNFKKRLRQGSLLEFIHITKMPKITTENSASNPLGAVAEEARSNNGDNMNNTTSEANSSKHLDSGSRKKDELSNPSRKAEPSESSETPTEFGNVSSLSQEVELVSSNTKAEISGNSNILAEPHQEGVSHEKPQENLKSSTQLSEDLFPSETDSLDSDISSEKYSTDFLKRYTKFPPSLPLLRPSEDHSVLFDYNTVSEKVPLPYPKTFKDKWDSSHVRLPCSPQSFYPVKNALTGEDELNSRWDIIQKALSNPIRSPVDLEEAILTYNSQYSKQWNFKGLHRLFREKFEPSETEDFFQNLLPKMIDLCLQIPNLCTQPIPLLKLGKNHKLTFSQKQVACLLANAFFCTFPRRNTRNRNSEFSSYPGINFYTLFDPNGRPNKLEKLKCVINYFRRVTKEEPTGIITYHRQSLREFPSWKESEKRLANLCVQSEGLIEVDGMGMLQIDFANKFVGGGVLGSGCVQEEIRFVICPELIVARLFTERLDKNESLIVTGCEQFNQHTGYAESFQWDGDFEDCIPRDLWGRKLTKVVAIDALHFACGFEQYNPELVQRELDKSYAGFLESAVPEDYLPAVATGNWGCGAFRGDPRLKALIQLMSASEAGRDLLYITFNDKTLEKDLRKVYYILKCRNLKVGQLAKMLEAFYHQVVKTNGNDSLYSFLFQCCIDSDSETDVDAVSQ